MKLQRIDSIARTRRAGAALLVVVVAVLGAWGCGSTDQDRPAKGQRPVYKVPVQFNRELNPFELDSLRTMKATWGITRDEYWDEHGGVIGNADIEVWYPQGKVNILQGAAMFKYAEQARSKTKAVFGRVPKDHLVIVCAGNLDIFKWATGRQWWQYSLIKGDTISVQAPIDLHTRGLLPVVAPREYYEWAVIKLSAGKAPRWLQEGMASYLSGEAPILEDQRQDFASLGPVGIPPEQTEKTLFLEKDRRETRRAYYNAYRMVEELVMKHGEPAVAGFVTAIADEFDLNAASKRAFGEDYNALLAEASQWEKGENAR